MVELQLTAQISQLHHPPSDVAELQEEISLTSLEFPLTSDGNLLSLSVLSTSCNYDYDHRNCPEYHQPLVEPMLSTCIASCQLLLILTTNESPTDQCSTHHSTSSGLKFAAMAKRTGKLISMFAMPSDSRPPVVQEDDSGTIDVDQNDMFTDTPRFPSPIGAASQSQPSFNSSRISMTSKLVVTPACIGNIVALKQSNDFVEAVWGVKELFCRRRWCLDQKIIEQSNKRRRGRSGKAKDCSLKAKHASLSASRQST